MREIFSIALLIGLAVCIPSEVLAQGEPGAPAQDVSSADPNATKAARDKIVDLLFSDEVDRIDFRATTFDEASVLIQTTADKILAIGMPVLDDAQAVGEKGAAVIEALNTSAARGMALTFSKNKQELIVENLEDAAMLGEVVGETIAIIRGYYGPAEVSYRDKAGNLFHKVRLNPEDSESLLFRHLETVQHVQGSSESEKSKFLN